MAAVGKLALVFLRVSKSTGCKYNQAYYSNAVSFILNPLLLYRQHHLYVKCTIYILAHSKSVVSKVRCTHIGVQEENIRN